MGKSSGKRRSAGGAPPVQSAHQPKTQPGVRLWWPYVVIVVAVLLTFGRTLFNAFVDWDDVLNIHMNPAVIAPTWERFFIMWTHPYAELFVPMVYTSYIFDAFVSGGHAWSFHLSNVLLHAGVSLCVFGLIKRIVGSVPAALVGALVFALHPIQVEPVAWVTGRKDVLSGCAMMAALLLYDDWQQRGRWWRTALGTFLFAVALAAKPLAVVTPVMAAALLVYRGKWQRPQIAAVALWLLLALVWTFLTLKAQTGMEDAPFLVPLWKRPFVASDALVFYAKKIMLPIGFAPIYPHGMKVVFSTPWTWACLPLVLVVLGLAWLGGKRVMLAAALFIVPLLPVLGFTAFLFQYHSTVADRYCYVSMLGVGLAVALLMQYIVTRCPGRARIAYGLACGVLVLLALISVRQCGYWEDAEALWTRELAIAPANPDAHYNLASTYAESRRWADARKHFEAAITIEPRYAKSYTNLMIMAREMGQPADIEAAARRTVAMFPDYDPAQPTTRGNVEEFVAVGTASLNLHDYKRAAWAFRGALRGAPDDVDAWNNLAIALVNLNNDAEAVDAFQRVLMRSPSYPRAEAGIALALLKLGREREALPHLERAVAQDPGDEASVARLEALRQQGVGR